MMRLEKNSRFKSFFKVKAFEWCDLTNGRMKANSMVKNFIDSISTRLPAAMKKCPIDGQMSVFNVPLKNQMMKIFPPGLYRISAHGYIDEDPLVFFFSILIKLEN